LQRRPIMLSSLLIVATPYPHRHTVTLCNILQHSATHCNTLQQISTHCNTLHNMLDARIIRHSSVIPPSTHSNTLQRAATHCNTLQHTATHCTTCLTHSLQGTHLLCPPIDTLQHTATHCTTYLTPSLLVIMTHLHLPC